MTNLLKRYWNLSIWGIPKFIAILLRVIYLSFYDSVSTFFWRYNFKECGQNVFIQKGSSIRFPGNIILENAISIGRNCHIDSEFDDSTLKIGSGSQINKYCNIDFSGNLVIGNNVVISENVILMSHDHGYNPHSIPEKIKKIIEDNVWIGSNSIILSKVELIGKNSIVASGSIVTKSVPDNCIVAGNPAKVISTINL